MQHHESDLRAGFTGLLLGAVALLLICFAIVKLVDMKHSSGGAEAGHVTQH